MPYDICACPENAYCHHLCQNLVGRIFTLAKLDNDLGRRYRAQWRMRCAAGGGGLKPQPVPPKDGQPKKGGCGCGPKK